MVSKSIHSRFLVLSKSFLLFSFTIIIHHKHYLAFKQNLSETLSKLEKEGKEMTIEYNEKHKELEEIYTLINIVRL